MADALKMRWGGPVAMGLTGALAGVTLNQSTDAAEFIFQVPEAVTITKIGMRQSSITGTPPDYKLSLQGVDASGNPDGTIKGGGSPASVTITPGAGDTGAFAWKTLDNSYAASRGEFLAIVFAYTGSKTIDSSNRVSWSLNVGTLERNNFPYATFNDNGSRTRYETSIFGYASASKAYGFPAKDCSTLAYNSGSSPNEYAMAFNIPTTFCATYTVVGVRFPILPGASTTLDAKLYSGTGAGDTTVLQSVTFDSDVVQAAATMKVVELYFDESTLSTLNAGSGYRLSIVPGSATNQTLVYVDVSAVADWDAMPYGQQVWTSTRAGGNWTDVTTRRLVMELILADVTQAAGGGGGPLVGPSALVSV